ncbi:hypothetical protein O6H91_06G015700 [Diphasiastrum complanatum]|uniref:Uncharacterized protein n=1 Tax=Diphasiastrum complanatum TaxID=34168 RepID=A0ACC2DBT4_DIPCM|nr:hypothetical protein O6H91_06G015700 [Diphasiastrum complanatum]
MSLGATKALALLVLLLLQLKYGCLMEGKCSFPAIFNFGDSTSDTGGIQSAFPTFSQSEFPPYGITFFGKPAWRYSDGRLAIDFICQALGLPFLSAYLQSVGSDFSTGVNFATAGATARAINYITPFSLNVQLNQFNEFRLRSGNFQQQQKQPSSSNLPTPDVFSQALYIVDIGGNDFTYGYNRNMSFHQIKSYLPQVVEAISTAVEGLYEAGARTILVSDVGPQGCTPYILTNFGYLRTTKDALGCGEEFNDIVRYYNSQLKQAVGSLRSQLANASIVYVDSFSVKYQLTANASQNGFQFTTRACCGAGGPYNYDNNQQCGRSKTQFGNFDLVAPSCSNPSIYLNWDGVHFTEAANHYTVQQLLTSKFFDPSDFDLDQLCDLNPI